MDNKKPTMEPVDVEILKFTKLEDLELENLIFFIVKILHVNSLRKLIILWE